jgi:glycosyl transferase family 25
MSADLCAQLNQFFDKIYVIHLTRNSDRKEWIDNNLRGLDVTFWEAVDGRALSTERIAELHALNLTAPHASRRMTRGELGNALSHRSIYEDVVREGHRRVLILEDDVALLPGNAPFARAILAQLPPDWDLLYLGYGKYEHSIANSVLYRLKFYSRALRSLVRTGRATERKPYTRPYSRNLRIAGSHDGSFAYAMSRAGCEKLLGELETVVSTSDGLLNRLCETRALRAFVANPKLLVHVEHLPSVLEVERRAT